MESDPEPPGTGVAAFFSGLAGKLASATHIVRAISRLVAGMADVPTAWFEGWAERIRVDTRARSELLRAVAAAATKEAANDPALVDRAVDRWGRDLFRKQENREAVALKTIQLLQEAPPSPDVDSGPSDDFMNVFEELAAKASSDNLRDLLGRVLAGELRRPGHFSLRTLHFMSTIDQPLAAAIQQARSWTIGRMIPLVEPLTQQPDYQIIFAMQEAGILEVGLEHRFTWNSSGRYVLPFSDVNMGLLLTGAPGAELFIPVAQLTTVGSQVMELLPAQPDVEHYKLLVDGVLLGGHAPLRDWTKFAPGFDLKPLKRVALVKILSVAAGGLNLGEEIYATGDSDQSGGGHPADSDAT